MKLRLSLATLVAILAALLFVHDARAAACVPGQQVSCACPGGTSGVQACATDGSRFEACACTAPAPTVAQPPPPAPARPSWRDEDDEDGPRRRWRAPPPGRGLFRGGLAMVIIGGVLIPVGIALVVVGGNHDCKDSSFRNGSYSGQNGSLALCGLGAGLLVIDAGLIVGGIAMMVAGKNKAADAEGPRLPAWVPHKVAVSTDGLSLGWRF